MCLLYDELVKTDDPGNKLQIHRDPDQDRVTVKWLNAEYAWATGLNSKQIKRVKITILSYLICQIQVYNWKMATFYGP